MFRPFDEGHGWQFHFHRDMGCRRWQVIWSSYGIVRKHAYVRRRLFIWHWKWFHVWMDLGILSVRYDRPMEGENDECGQTD